MEDEIKKKLEKQILKIPERFPRNKVKKTFSFHNLLLQGCDKAFYYMLTSYFQSLKNFSKAIMR